MVAVDEGSDEQAQPGRDVAIEWNGRAARAWVPAPLARRHMDPGPRAAVLSERAAGAVLRVGDRLPGGWEPLARLLLRAEGVASSDIEGLRARPETIAAAEVGEGDAVASWVADNLAVVAEALDRRRDDLTEAALHGWHRRLMVHGQLAPDLVGAYRDRQGWIGGRGPQDAAYVPPPADEVPSLMSDLVDFANRQDVEPIAQAAILHAQFETIHPYGDGNGRIGRLIVLWSLARRLDVAVPPPTSVMIARDAGGYLAGLYWFRTGEHDRWIEWFARVVEAAALQSLAWASDVDQVMDDHRARLADLRADAAARSVVELLPRHPVVSAALVADELSISPTAARSALQALESRGVIEPYVGAAGSIGRPRAWWVDRSLADLVGAWAG